MNNKFEINDTTRVIAVRGDRKIICNFDKQVNDITFEKGVIIDNSGRIISPVLPIGSFLKQGYWQEPSENEKIINNIYK